MSRVHQPFVLPGRIYVPPMDLRNRTPEEARAWEEHVLRLRRQNLDAELQDNADHYEMRGQEWHMWLLQRLVLFGATVALVSTAFCYSVLHGIVKSGEYTYRNRRQIRGSFFFAVESTYNAAKRRLVSVSGSVNLARRVRSNLRPPSPRRRNGVIRQPPMTSNLARWEEELQARREESRMVMEGVESDSADGSDHMMSGAIVDCPEGDYINPHFNPFYAPLPIDTTALDACVRNKIHPNASMPIFAASRNDGEDGDLRMSDPEDMTAQQYPVIVRHSYTDFSPPHSVESHEPESKNQFAIVDGPDSADVAVFNNRNTIASSTPVLTTHKPADAFTPPPSDTDSPTSALITATGAMGRDASYFSEPPAEPIIHKPHQTSTGPTKHEPFNPARVDDVSSDLSDDMEQQELPLCDFQNDTEQRIAMELCRASDTNMKLESNSGIDCDEESESPSAHAATSVPIESASTPKPVSASNAIPIQIEDQEGPSLPGSFHEDERVQNSFSRSSGFEVTEQPASSVTTFANDISLLKFTPTHGFEQVNFPLSPEQLDKSVPISSMQILEQESSGQTTPSEKFGQRNPLSLPNLTGFPDQQSSPLSPAPSDSSLPVTSVLKPKQRSPKSNLITPKRIAKKTVMFFKSPKTGRPITRTKKFILGEAMDFPVSSSPAPASLASTESSILEIDSPTIIAETEALVRSFAQRDPSTPISIHHSAEKAVFQEEGEVDNVGQMSENPEPAGSLTSDISHDEEVMIEVTSSRAGSLEADKPAIETSSSETAADSSLIQPDKPCLDTQSTVIMADRSLIETDRPFLEIQFTEKTADTSLVEPDKPAAAEASSAGIGLAGADKSTAESIGTVMTEEHSVIRVDEPVIESEFSEMTADSLSKEADKPAMGEGSPAGSLLVAADISTAEDVDTTTRDDSSLGRADKPVIEKAFTQETAGSSLDEADKPAEEEDVATDRDEGIASTSGNVFSIPLHETWKLASPASSLRKTTPNRHTVKPARKSLRLQNKSAKISPPRPAKIGQKLTVLDLSGGYGTTAITSKYDRRVLKAERARAKQAAIEAAEEARRIKEEAEEKARKEAEEAKEKARVAKEEAEEKARKEQEEAEERQRKTTRRIPKEKIIQPLTAEWEAKVQAAMETPDMRTVLVTLPSGTKLTRKDFGTLKVVPGRDPSHGWLNDEIILASLQQVVDYGLRMSNHGTGKTPKYHAFNTFFYKNLRDKGAQSVKRWATKAKIGGRALEEVERVFIPVHQGAHWTLLVVSPAARTIEYFDSMGGVAESYIRNAKLWLATEMGARFKENEWAVPTGTHGVGPRQTNMSDCGVFTCTTARMVALGIDPMAYGGEDMGVQRGLMVAELLNGGLFGDFDPKVEF